IDIWEVIEAAQTKPFGYMPFFPGPGLGGHCIPVDPFYLSWKAREYGIFTRFIELAGEINTNMPGFVVQKVMEALSDHGQPIKAARILVLGLAYKPNIDDDRESPSYDLMQRLQERGAIVSYNDPNIPIAKPSTKFASFESMKSVEISSDFDLFLIATGHDEYTEIDFSKYGVPTVDTRNILKKNSPLYYKA
ncbi:MAG: UDP binding domain-containing protein, partial [Candidatus Neomarinimicrobiota bacterium]